jgi:hypothetical protein
MSDTLTAAKVEEIVNSIVTRTHNLLTPFTSPDPTAFSNPPNGASYRVTATTATGQTIIGESQPLTVSADRFTWTKPFGGTGTEFAIAVCTDSGGNIYTVGSFTSPTNFGGVTLSPIGLQDVFLTKHSVVGTLMFAKQFGSAGAQYVAKNICLDPSNNIFISGTLAGGSLMKLDSSGVQQWVKGPVKIGSGFTSAFASFDSISAGSDGSIVATGSFVAPLSNPLEFGDSHPLLSTSGSTDAFLAKYSSAGTCLWAYGFYNWGDTEYGTGVIVDRSDSNKIFLAGYHLSGIKIGEIVLGNGASGASGYLAKFDSSGTLIGSLARSIGVNGGQTGYCRVNCMALDSAGNVILGGDWNNNCDWGGGNRVSFAPQQAAFFAKYNGTTLAYLWDLVVPSGLYTHVQRIAVDASNNIYATGAFARASIFGATTLTSLSDQNYTTDIFVTKITPSGSFVWAVQAGGTDAEGGNGIAVSITNGTLNGPVAVGGFLNNVNGQPATFGSTKQTSNGGTDTFVMLLNPA